MLYFHDTTQFMSLEYNQISVLLHNRNTLPLTEKSSLCMPFSKLSPRGQGTRWQLLNWLLVNGNL